MIIVASTLCACDSKKAMDARLDSLRIELSDLSKERKQLDAELHDIGRSLSEADRKQLASWKKLDLANKVQKLEVQLDGARAEEATATEAAAAAKQRLEDYRSKYSKS